MKKFKSFWATFLYGSILQFSFTTSDWLVSKGVKRKEAENYARELFSALSEDAINKKIIFKTTCSRITTPGGTNAFVLRELKKKEILQSPTKSLK